MKHADREEMFRLQARAEAYVDRAETALDEPGCANDPNGYAQALALLAIEVRLDQLSLIAMALTEERR